MAGLVIHLGGVVSKKTQRKKIVCFRLQLCLPCRVCCCCVLIRRRNKNRSERNKSILLLQFINWKSLELWLINLFLLFIHSHSLALRYLGLMQVSLSLLFFLACGVLCSWTEPIHLCRSHEGFSVNLSMNKMNRINLRISIASFWQLNHVRFSVERGLSTTTLQFLSPSTTFPCPLARARDLVGVACCDIFWCLC